MSSAISAVSSRSGITPAFPDAFFLDAELFRSVSHSVLKCIRPVPGEVSQLLGLDANLICDSYFDSINTWFPFISKKKMQRGIQANNPAEVSGLALVLLCMKLATNSPQQDGVSASDSVLYRTARRYLNALEEASSASLHVLQAFVLVALYEVGHGIFPAAYLTVGRAARIGLLRGVHDRKNATQLFQTPQTWTSWEEERRTWWAVSILER